MLPVSLFYSPSEASGTYLEHFFDILLTTMFSLFHLYSLLYNTTTIEGWEKDKAALMVKRGKLREVC